LASIRPDVVLNAGQEKQESINQTESGRKRAEEGTMGITRDTAEIDGKLDFIHWLFDW
jgi:hypothetical protein